MAFWKALLTRAKMGAPSGIERGRLFPAQTRRQASIAVFVVNPRDIAVPVSIVMVDQFIGERLSGLDAFLERVQEMCLIGDQFPGAGAGTGPGSRSRLPAPRGPDRAS